MLLQRPLIQLETSKGSLDLVLFEDELPNTTACLLNLVEQGFFNGTRFGGPSPDLRLNFGRDIQGMGAGFHIPLEFPRKLSYDAPGMLGLAGTGEDNGSEFFLSREALPHLDGLLPLVGRTVRGLAVLAQLESGDTLKSAMVLQKRGHAYDFYQEITKNTRVALSRT